LSLAKSTGCSSSVTPDLAQPDAALVFEDAKGGPVDRQTLLERMRGHIHTVVGRYKGRIKGWDVVNEALDEDGTCARRPG
jgi:endo-1,4-beta-xylanase